MPRHDEHEFSPRYRVEGPEGYDSLKFERKEKHAAEPVKPSAAPERAVPAHALVAEGGVLRPAKAEEEAPEKRAVWIVHGMGSQLRFETLDSLTEGILSVAKRNPANANVAPTAQAVKIGDQIVERVKLTIAGLDQNANRKYELHLYEAYWAPVTEGVAKLRDVVSFLFDGGTRGILNWMKRFKLAMFDRMCKFRIPFRSAFFLTVTMLVLLALIWLNAVIVAASSAQINVMGEKIGITLEQWRLLASFASSMSAIAISFGGVLFLAELCKAPRLKTWRRLWLGFVSWAGTIFTVLAILICAVFFAWDLLDSDEFLRYADGVREALQGLATAAIFAALAVVGLAMLVRAIKRSDRSRRPDFHNSVVLYALLVAGFLVLIFAAAVPVMIYFGSDEPIEWAARLPHWFRNPWWVWAFLGFVSAKVRTLLVEYPGDVAIYITPNKLDRFDKVREEIKDIAMKSATAVYTAAAPGGNVPEYKKVAVIGHSLGSVIAYDTLNALINLDELSGRPLEIVERTCLFETFGSPLDKIAFLFTIQGKDSFQVRGQLVEAVRPMIRDYALRPFPWVNVKSRNDIISGPLKFYDLPENDACDCENLPMGVVPGLPAGVQRAIEVTDRDAAVALAAHVDYWKNETVWEELLARVAP